MFVLNIWNLSGDPVPLKNVKCSPEEEGCVAAPPAEPLSVHRKVLPHCQDGEGESLNRQHKLLYKWIISSVADPGCLSPIPDPDLYPSRIPAPKIATKERGEKKIVDILFFVATKFTKFEIILFLKCRRKKFGQISKNYWSFYPKSCN